MTENLSTNNKKRLGLRIGLTVVFVVVVVLAAFFTYERVQAFISTWEMTDLPGVSISNAPTPTPGSGSEAEAAPVAESEAPIAPIPSGPQPDPWDGASRVTILIMGLDYRDWESGEGPPRTDTMILLTIDPQTKTAGMLSIPRDLWVNIPGGYGYYKINEAYQLGEGNRLPGGGPDLARKTVESLIGVPVDYYAQIDFSAFERFIDEIGGVKIDVPKKIWVDILGDEKGRVRIQAGVQTLPGDYALAYVRARNTEGGDFDRAQRQQQVILGIRDRILSFDLIPILITKAPVLYQELSAGVNTNLSLDQAIQLAWLAQQIPVESIQRAAIGTQQVNFAKSADGLDILKPLPDQVRLLRDQIFATGGHISPSADSTADSLELLQDEKASISVLNGTLTTGLASRTSEYLGSLGANVALIGDAEAKDQPYSSIYDYTGNPYTVKHLVELFNISEFRVFFQHHPESEVDVTIILGNDWISNNPMP